MCAISSPEIPIRMRWNGQQLNAAFAGDERLFHRLGSTDIFEERPNGSLFVAFDVGRVSVNRSHPDGEPLDVLLCDHPKHKDAGVIWFSVGDVPTIQTRDNAEAICYQPEVDPDPLNIYHCEIRAFRGSPVGQRCENIKPVMKTWFRAEMSKRMRVDRNVVKPPANGIPKQD